MYNLTQLEQAGFEFTPLEKLVFENPSFQFLYGRGWPIRWGSLTTGLIAKVGRDHYQNEAISFKPTDQEKLTPHGAGTFFDEVSVHIRSVSILSAKVARDASENESDQDLVQDLSLWLDGMGTYPHQPFRWVRFERDHTYELKQKARAAEVAMLSQGQADVIVLLLGKLAQRERQSIRDAIEADCLKRGIFGEGNDHRSQFYHLPWLECVLCDDPHDRKDGRNCVGSIAMVDCGDVPTIMKAIPADVRRLVKPVRFKVPKSTFSDRFVGCVGTDLFPRFAIFSLEKLSQAEQRGFKTEFEKGLEQEITLQERSGYNLFRQCQIIAPAGRQRLNAILFAGGDGNNWTRTIRESDFWRLSREEKKVRVDVVR